MPALLVPAAAEEVAVVGAHAHGIGAGALSHADAEAARPFSQMRAPASIMSCSAPLALSMLSTCRLPGAMTSDTSGFTVLPLRNGGHAHHVQIAGVGARADAHLIHMDGAGLGHGFSRCRACAAAPPSGTSADRSISTALVIRRIRVGGQRDKVRLAALAPSGSRASTSSEGNTGRRRAQLRAHVGNGRTFGDGTASQRPAPCTPSPCPRRALDGEAAQQFQNHGPLAAHTSAEPPP